MSLARDAPLLMAGAALLGLVVYILLDAPDAPLAPEALRGTAVVERSGIETAADASRQAAEPAPLVGLSRASAPPPGADALLDVSVSDGEIGLSLELLVIDVEGGAVAAARVEVWADRPERLADAEVSGSWSGQQRPGLVLRTGSDGRVVIDGLRAAARIVAHHPVAGVSAARRVLELSEGDGSDGAAVLELEPGWPLHGRVVDAAGEPVAGAVLRALALDDDWREREPWVHGELSTDVDGGFRLSVVGAAVAQLQAGLAGVRSAQVRVEAGVLPLELVLGGRHELVVEVVDPEGNPLAGMEVEALRRRQDGLTPGVLARDVRVRVRSDDSGMAAVRLPDAGAHLLVVSGPGRETRTDHVVTLHPPRDRRHTRVVLRPLVLLAGRVLDGGGRAVGRGVVAVDHVRPLPDGLGQVVAPGDARRLVDVDAEGRFALNDVEPSGRYDLTWLPPERAFAARDDRSARVQGVLPGTLDVLLVLEEPALGAREPASALPEEAPEVVAGTRDAAVVLMVRSGLDGAAVSRVVVAREVLDVNGGEWRVDRAVQVLRADDGVMRVSGLVAGRTYRFALSADGHAPVRSAGVVASREPPRVELRPDANGALRVSVLAPSGGAAAHAEVRLFEQKGAQRIWPPCRADASGVVTFEELGPGPYRVEVRQGVRTGTVDVIVRPGETAAAVLTTQA